MALELLPETEEFLRGYAAQEKISIDELIRRTFAMQFPLRLPGEGITDTEKRDSVLAYIHQSSTEIARQNAPSIAQLQTQLATAENASAAEVAEAEAEWHEHTEIMNENRRANNERLLYRERLSR